MEIKLLEICRSFSQTIQFKPFEPVNFFCSAKEECEEKDMEATAKKLVHFCKLMVIADIKNFLKEHPEIQYKEEVIDANTLQPLSEQLSADQEKVLNDGDFR